MKILVTGAGGFIGGHLVEHLASLSHTVIAQDIKPIRDWVYRSDLRNVVMLSEFQICSHPDLIYHLGSYQPRVRPSFKEPVRYVESNVLGTARILEYARINGNIPVIYAGSSTADGDEFANPYACTKKMGEDLCRLYERCYELPTIITRFYNVYGPREESQGANSTVIATFYRLWREGKKLTIIGDGEQTRDFLHVDDLVNGLELIGRDVQRSLAKYKGWFSLGSGRAISINEIAKAFTGGDTDGIEYLPRVEGEMRSTLAVTTPMRELGWTPRWNVFNYINELKRDGN